MRRLRVGVVGVGHLGRHHARILAGVEGVELVGVADVRLEQARAVAEPLGTLAFDDYRELLDRVDAVSVAVPTTFHREVAGAFLERGVHTLVEKPLATTVAEGEELLALARSQGVVFQVGHIERYNPIVATLAGSEIRPRYVSAERLGIFTFRSTDIGVVHDLMIHDLDLLLAMVPAPVRSVSAVGVAIFGVREDVAHARIEFEDGTVADLSASRASYATSRKFRVWGAEGYITLDLTTKLATIVRPSERLQQGELDLEGLDLTQPAAIKEHLFSKLLQLDQVRAEGREPLALELEDFVAVVQNGSTPRVTGEDGLRALRVAEEVVQRLKTHRWDQAQPDAIPDLASATSEPQPIVGLAGPKFWRGRAARNESNAMTPTDDR